MSENCDGCGEDTSKLYLHSACHTEFPTWAILDTEKQEVEIICAKCEKSIVKYKILRVIE